MKMCVTFPSSSFGGSHDITDYNVTITYTGYDDWDYYADKRDMSIDGAIGSQVFKLLKGKICPRDIDGIAEKGEIFSRLHVETILERWDYIDRSQLPFQQELERLELLRQKRKRTRSKNRLYHALRKKSKDIKLRISIRALDEHSKRQSGGFIEIPVGSAKSLAQLILKACKLSIAYHGLKQHIIEK